MSSLGIFDFVANNLLDELGLHPVWEKFRKFFYAVGVGISLFALYVTLQIKVQCALQYSNGTVIRTDLHPRHVNEYCRNSDSVIIFRYSGCILLGFNVAILVSASYWLHCSNVSKPLRTFAKIRGLVDEIQLPWEEMKHLMSFPMNETELSKNPTDATYLLKKRKQLREVMKLLPTIENRSDRQKTEEEREECCCIPICHTLQACLAAKNRTEANAPLLASESNRDRVNHCCSFCDSNIATRYRTRNIVLGITCLFVVITLLILIGLMISTVHTFNCRYDLTTEHENYICTIDVGFVAIGCTIVDALAVICQMVVIGIGFVEVRKVLNAENTKNVNLLKLPTLMLINRFYESSQSSDSEVMSNLIKFFFSKEFEYKVNCNVSTTGIETDSELFELTGARYTNKNDPILALPYKCRQLVCQKFSHLLHITNFTMKIYLPLAMMLAEHELWKEFIDLLKNVEDLTTRSDKDKLDFKQSIQLNFDSLASNYSEIKRLSDDFYQHTSTGSWHGTHSLLYYATDMKERKNFQVAIFLLTCFKPSYPYIHHSSGTGHITSVKAMEYVTDPSRSYEEFKDYNDLISNIRKCETQSNEEGQHDGSLEDMLQRYQSVNRENETGFIGRFGQILRRRRIRKWGETANKILEAASTKKHSDIEIALLLAYFSTDSSSPKSPLSYLCGEGPIPSDKCIEEIIKVALKAWEYELEDCKNLVKYLADKYRWDMLVILLNNTKTRCDLSLNENLILFLGKLEINLKRLGSGYLRDDCNILKEALLPSNISDLKCRLAVAKFICLVSKPQLFDIMGDKRKSLVNEIRQIPRGATEHETIDDFESLKAVISESELQYLIDKYTSTGLDEESIKRVAEEPLRQWNSQVHNFAGAAAENRDWKIVVSLICAHIAENNFPELMTKIDHGNVKLIWKRIVANQPQNSTRSICELVEQYFSEQ